MMQQQYAVKRCSELPKTITLVKHCIFNQSFADRSNKIKILQSRSNTFTRRNVNQTCSENMPCGSCTPVLARDLHQ
jgi:hypothetical protein